MYNPVITAGLPPHPPNASFLCIYHYDFHRSYTPSLIHNRRPPSVLAFLFLFSSLPLLFSSLLFFSLFLFSAHSLPLPYTPLYVHVYYLVRPYGVYPPTYNSLCKVCNSNFPMRKLKNMLKCENAENKNAPRSKKSLPEKKKRKTTLCARRS